MNLIRMSTPGRKRQMVFVPELNGQTFMFFFEKGTTGGSYSLRDYSAPFHVRRKDAREIGWSASEVRRRAVHIYDAPTLDTNRLDEWHAYTTALNQVHGLAEPACGAKEPAPIPPAPVTRRNSYPLLNVESFRTLAKAAKTSDVRRMLESPNSEDWLTWNLLNLLAHGSVPWWAKLCRRIKAGNSHLDQASLSTEPSVLFWLKVPSPKKYESESRSRMRQSQDPILVARSRDPKPVEGGSEIDIVFESNTYAIFVEAKLYSDISMRTTYDCSRNQIVRNIDCLLERADGRRPLFWMFVHDLSSARAYVQLMEQYRRNPELLARDLPHRDPAILRAVSGSLSLTTWQDLGKEACAPDNRDDEEVAFIKREILRRIK